MIDPLAIEESLQRIEAEIAIIREEIAAAPPEPPSGDVIHVPPDASLQAAVNAALPGQTLTLEPGATYPGPIRFPLRAMGEPIVLTTVGTWPSGRVSPDAVGQYAVIAATNPDGALRFDGETHSWTIRCVQLSMDIPTHDVVVIQNGAGHLVFDRLLSLHPSGQKRIIRANGHDITLSGCHLNGGAVGGQDSQAYCAWSGRGPHTMVDNFLAASGENIMFGGADSLSDDDTPADILISGNHLWKDPTWKAVKGSVKNLLELKNAKRVRIHHNRLENNWTDAQSGYGVLFTPKNQSGNAPWTTVRDVIFEENVLIGTERGINVSGRDYLHVNQRAEDITIRRNVIECLYQAFLLQNEMGTLTIEENVTDNGRAGSGTRNIAVLSIGGVLDTEGAPTRTALYVAQTCLWNGNTHRDCQYGIKASLPSPGSAASGTASLDATMPDYEFRDNHLEGLQYPYPPTTVGIDDAAFQAAKASLLDAITD